MCVCVCLRSLGIVIASNTGTHGNLYSDHAMEKAHDAVDELLRDSDNNLRVRRGAVSFNPGTHGVHKRSLTHPLWICVSDQEQEGELLSVFSRSALWNQRAVQGVDFKPVSEYVVPGPDSLKIGGPTSFSKAQQFKQHISGRSLMDALQQAVWKGVNPTMGGVASWLDLVPYDTSLVEALAQADNPKAPMQMACSAFTCAVQQATLKDQALWFESASTRCLESFLRARSWKEFAQEGERPTYSTADFELCRVVAEDNGDLILPLRQDALTEWGNRFARFSDQFTALVAEHDKEFNPSGRPWKNDHPAPATEETEEQAEPWTGETVDLETVNKSGKVQDIVSFMPSVHLLFTSDHRLFLHPVADVVVPASKALFQVYGDYVSGAEVQQRKDALGNDKLWDWAMTSLDYQATFKHPDSWTENFPDKLSSLKSFLAFMQEKQSISKVDIVCHEYDPAHEVVAVKEPCAYEAKKLPKRSAVESENCGSLLEFSDVSWNSGTHNFGMLELRSVLRYMDTPQQKGIYPQKPGWHLKKSVRLTKGSCYRVA